MRNRIRVAIGLGFFVAGLAYLSARADGEGAGDCAQRSNVVVVNLDSHRLSLCQKERAAQTYTVSLGSGGIGKRQEGDHRTPIGSFALGEPRPSTEFLLFIPVGYPTAEQRRAGYTGGDIGIHGPKRSVAWLGRLANWKDWTRGCIAINSEDDIREVAGWVQKNHTARVELIHAASR